jgi:hypothetical protein
MKCESGSTAKRSAARRDLLAGPRKQGSIVASIMGSECHRTAGRRERAELDGMAKYPFRSLHSSFELL